VPHGWSIHRRAEPDHFLPLKFALTQSNLHNLDAYLLDVSDPQSVNYGKHWTTTKVADTFHPSRETVDTVRSWLVDSTGIEPHKITPSLDGGALHLNVTVSEAERILAAEYYIYRHGEDGSERIGCHQGYSLPAHVSEHIDFVWPAVYFGGLSPRMTGRSTVLEGRRGSGYDRVPTGQAPRSVNPKDCDKLATLDCVRALYNFNYEIVSADKNALGVLEVSPGVYKQSDIDEYFKLYVPDQVGNSPTLVSVDDGDLTMPDDPNANGTNILRLEATLDLELAMGLVGRKQEVLVYQVKDDGTSFVAKLLAGIDGSYCSAPGVDTDALNITDCGNKPFPKVISASWTTLDFDVNEYAGYNNADAIARIQRECTEIGKLSLTGMTFITCSSDNGVYGTHANPFCDLIKNTTSQGEVAPFLPTFPSSCPYVTSVGATEVSPGKSVHDRETSAMSVFVSGGGFSNTFPRPSYQNGAVSRYLKDYAPSYGPEIFNRSGRAYPDVAANGWPIPIVLDGDHTYDGGTSASTPIFASMIVAVNDARLAVGKGPVGWINPALYSHVFASAFNDVTNGTNVACGMGGFPAARGWDPVTGLGTPNFERLLAAFMALP
ncbi:peptidase S8/S53 domain-containing protein, partial [Fomes fomentarius]